MVTVYSCWPPAVGSPPTVPEIALHLRKPFSSLLFSPSPLPPVLSIWFSVFPLFSCPLEVNISINMSLHLSVSVSLFCYTHTDMLYIHLYVSVCLALSLLPTPYPDSSSFTLMEESFSHFLEPCGISLQLMENPRKLLKEDGGGWG